LRFAVHGPGCPVASPRSHGVPRRDVPGRINVSIAGESAGSTTEDGLALARVPVHLPARRAALTRVMRLNFLHAAGRLLFQATHQQSPCGLKDAPVQSSLGADVATWDLQRSSRRPGHVPDFQVFYSDHVEPAHEVGAGFLRPVFPTVGFSGAQPGDRVPDLCAPVRAASRAEELALQAPQPLALPRGQTGHMQQFPSGQGRGHRNAPVYAHDLSITRCRDRIGNGCKGDMPAPCSVDGHSVGPRARRHTSGPAKPYPPDLRHPDLADVTGHSAHIPMPAASPYNPKTLIAPGFAPSRPPRGIAGVEECSHRVGEIAKRLLLYRLRAFRQPSVFCSCLRELTALLMVARGAFPSRAPVLVLLYGEVPYVPGVRTVVPKHRILGGGREQPIPGHANTLATITDISEGGEAVLALVSKPEGSKPRSK
jgi:hypothetical protein